MRRWIESFEFISPNFRHRMSMTKASNVSIRSDSFFTSEINRFLLMRSQEFCDSCRQNKIVVTIAVSLHAHKSFDFPGFPNSSIITFSGLTKNANWMDILLQLQSESTPR